MGFPNGYNPGGFTAADWAETEARAKERQQRRRSSGTREVGSRTRSTAGWALALGIAALTVLGGFSFGAVVGATVSTAVIGLGALLWWLWR